MKNIAKVSVILLITLLSFNSISQQLYPRWESCFGGTEWDEGRGILYSNNSYWIVAGTNSDDGNISYNHGTYDIWFFNIDTLGNLIKEKTFGGSYADGNYMDVKKLNDTAFYIAAFSQSIDGDISYNPWPGPDGNLWILQVSNKGEILWETMAGGTGTDELCDFIVTDDGGVLALSSSTSHDGDVSDHHGSWDLWMIKINSTGQKQWNLSLGGTGFEGGGSVKQTSDGGYIVAGYTDGAGGGNYDTTCNHHNPGSGHPDAWIVKIDSARNIQWQQCYGGTYPDACSNIIELDDGYLVLGHTMSNDGDVSGLHSPPGPNSDYGGDIWVFKIDFQGSLLWQKCLGGKYNDFARNIFPTSDGGFMIVGTTRSKDGDVVGNHDLKEGWFGDIWFAKIDSTGDLLWQYCYGGPLEETLYRGVVQKSDWDYVVTLGTFTNEWQCHGETWPDVRVVELYDSTVGVRETPAGKFGVKIYPNPTRSLLNIELDGNNGTYNATVELLDISGRAVLKKTFNAPQIQLNTSGITGGFYLVKVQTGKGVVTRKVVISH